MRNLIDNRYRIIDYLGNGSTGIVYRVEDIKNHIELALKLLSSEKIDKEALKFFQSEFYTMSQFQHPNLIKVHNF